MSFLVLWRLLPVLSLLYFSVLAELSYHDPASASPESGVGENAIADSWDIPPPQYGFGNNIVADSRGETTDSANSLQLNIAIASSSSSSDQAQSPESSWLSGSLDCSPNNNPIPNKKRRTRRQSDRLCPIPTDSMYNQPAPGTEAGTQPAPLVLPPPILRQDRNPTKKPNSAPKPKPILKGDPVDANQWVCDHRTVNYPVCADHKHATEKPLGSGSYDLLMAKLCEDFLSGHFAPTICCFRTGNWHYCLHLT